MKITQIKELLGAQVYARPDRLGEEVSSAAACDMLSDVLSAGLSPDVLITGLLNPQVIRTAVLLDARCVLFVRDKKPTEPILALAEESGVCVLSTAQTMFDSCGALYGCGLAGLH